MPQVTLVFPDRPLHRQSVVGAQEEITRWSGPFVERRPTDGRLAVRKPIYGEAFRIRLTNDGSGVEAPPFDDLDIGERVTLASSVWWRHYVPVGVRAVKLRRPPADERGVPMVHIRPALADGRPLDLRNVDYEYAVSVIRGFGYRDAMVIHYRPRFDCLLLDKSQGGGATGRDASWSLDLGEEHAS